jgi:urease accessory protein
MESNMIKAILIGLALTGFSTGVYAHSGHAGHGFFAGFSHPFTGADHLLVMVCLGLWAGKIGGAARWQLPLTFVLIMAFSAASGMLLMPAYLLEIGIAATVIAIGLLLSMRMALSRAAQFSLAALFALLHGLAHGAELNLADGVYVISGMVLATGLLHASGLLIAWQSVNLSRHLHALLGWMVMVAGSYMLFAVA